MRSLFLLLLGFMRSAASKDCVKKNVLCTGHLMVNILFLSILCTVKK
jgi:hypothetical protein